MTGSPFQRLIPLPSPMAPKTFRQLFMGRECQSEARQGGAAPRRNLTPPRWLPPALPTPPSTALPLLLLSTWSADENHPAGLMPNCLLGPWQPRSSASTGECLRKWGASAAQGSRHPKPGVQGACGSHVRAGRAAVKHLFLHGPWMPTVLTPACCSGSLPTALSGTKSCWF